MKKTIFFFITLLLTPLLIPQSARGLVYFWQKKPQSERLVFEFQTLTSAPKVIRSNYRSISIKIPPAILQQEPKPAPVDLSFSHLVEKIIIQQSNIIIQTKTNAIGFISFWKKNEQKLYLDLFFDPLGKRWKPPANNKPKKTSKKVYTQKKIQSKLKKKALKIKKTNALPKANPQNLDKKQSSKDSTRQTPPPLKKQSTATGNIQNKTNLQNKKSPLFKLKAKIKRVSIENAVILRPIVKVSNQTNPSDQTTAQPIKQNKKPTSQQKPKSDSKVIQKKPSTTENNNVLSPDNATNASLPNADTPDFEDLLITAKAAIANGELNAALETLKSIINHPKLPENLKEDVYYTYANVLFDLYKDKLPEGFEQIVAAYERAINYNPKSLNVPNALLKLGYLNLQVNNIPEAKGYFNLLRDKYPYDPSVPLTYFYWGEYYFKHRQYQKSADLFQTFITKYPDNKVAEDAAIYLAKSLKKLQFYTQGLEIVQYIEQRWPRYYLKKPYFLLDSAFLYYKNNKFPQAKQRYLLYINLLPEGENVDIALARIGDIYLLQKHKKAAKKLYELAATNFPDKEGGLIAAMRLAEEGIYDKPSIKDMFSVFNRPYNLRPEKIYTTIIQKYPSSPLAFLAKIKLAIWEIFNNHPEKSLSILKSFFDNPQKELKTKATEVALEAFTQILKKYLKAKNYNKIVYFVKTYPFLQKLFPYLQDEQKLLLATAYLELDKFKKAINIIYPILQKNPKLQSTKNALALALTLYLKLENWPKIIELGQKAKKWPLNKKQQEQVDFALALAYEKLKNINKSIPLWRKIASNIDTDAQKRAYALYFLANHYAKKRDWENVYVFSQEALSLFLEKAKNTEKDKIITCLKLLIQATSLTERKTEALGWALELKKYLTETHPSWPAFQYQLALLYKENGDKNAWQNALKELIQKAQNSLYAQMAKEDLNIAKLKQQAKIFEAKKP